MVKNCGLLYRGFASLLLLCVIKSTGSTGEVLFVCLFHKVEYLACILKYFKQSLVPFEALHIEPLGFLCTKSTIPHSSEASTSVILFI